MTASLEARFDIFDKPELLERLVLDVTDAVSPSSSDFFDRWDSIGGAVVAEAEASAKRVNSDSPLRRCA